MKYPRTRLRRLRTSPNLRKLVSENQINSSDFILPLFVKNGSGIEDEISSLPGQCQRSIDTSLSFINSLMPLGLKAVLLFGIPDKKDDKGLVALDENGIVQNTVKAIKDKFPQIIVVTDLCFCEYTTHGHCGVVENGKLNNDETLHLLAEQALSHAKAGADIIAPSGMLDGAVGAIRHILDEESFSDTAIMGYSAKFASSYYGPFREAVDSAPSFGDRKTYQMQPANAEEAMREVKLDIEEGADIVMVKPGLAYLDILYRVKSEFKLPTCAYHVSGSYAQLKAAAKKGWIDEEAVLMETMLSFKRAGADLVITYGVKDILHFLAN